MEVRTSLLLLAHTTSFISAGIVYRKGGGVRPEPFYTKASQADS